ncbi:MAG: hypothetical protein GY820_26825 [Gammaproteobacteria bacterium]|nr:hypothetical protein [Gammaproteobacteria bacterium]
MKIILPNMSSPNPHAGDKRRFYNTTDEIEKEIEEVSSAQRRKLVNF